jgi:Glutamine amidotransferase class-I
MTFVLNRYQVIVANLLGERGQAMASEWGLNSCCLSPHMPRGWRKIGLAMALLSAPFRAEAVQPQASASSWQADAPPAGALDGDRFGVIPGAVWKGSPGAGSWWWQCGWDEPRDVGAILQINGDDPLRLRNAPRKSKWQASLDGRQWSDLSETAVESESRTFRLHRLKLRHRVRYLRIQIDSAWGAFPTLREVQTFADSRAAVAFPPWIVIVSTLDKSEWERGHPEGRNFLPLARGCPGWENIQAQHVWVGDFDQRFVSVEPRPLCAFLSGNFSEWCQKERKAWQGTEEVLKTGRLPLWGSCGGAQGMAILATVGTRKPWDCPHCRDPLHPKSPIYGHIGHKGHKGQKSLKCGDYADCIFERGPRNVLQVVDDPVFRGLPRQFQVTESHCGQIEYVPPGWIQIAAKGAGTRTDMQCLRVKDRCIYAAQFHIEMGGTPQTSQRIMANFLELSKTSSE